MKFAGFVNTSVTTYFFMDESFPTERKSWGVTDNVQNLVSKKLQCSAPRDAEQNVLPGIVFIINRVFNIGLNCFSIMKAFMKTCLFYGSPEGPLTIFVFYFLLFNFLVFKTKLLQKKIKN